MLSLSATHWIGWTIIVCIIEMVIITVALIKQNIKESAWGYSIGAWIVTGMLSFGIYLITR
jgi:hypothetical protein